MKIGYARVSTLSQDTKTQVSILKKYGCEKIFEEKISGTKEERQELTKLFSHLREGDTVVVYSISRLGRTVKIIFNTIEKIKNMECNIISIKDNIDTTSAMGHAMFTVMSAFIQLERDLISERVKSALSEKRKRGIVGGRPRKKTVDVERAIKLYNTKEYTVNEIVKMTGISRATIYRYIREKGDNNDE